MKEVIISEETTYLEPIIEEESIELEEDAALISNKNTCNTQCTPPPNPT